MVKETKQQYCVMITQSSPILNIIYTYTPHSDKLRLAVLATVNPSHCNWLMHKAALLNSTCIPNTLRRRSKQGIPF